MWISVFLGQAKKIQMTEILTNFPLDNNHSKHLYFTFLVTFLAMQFHHTFKPTISEADEKCYLAKTHVVILPLTSLNNQCYKFITK